MPHQSVMKLLSLLRFGGSGSAFGFITSALFDIRFYLCFPLVLLIGVPAFELTRFLFSTDQDGVQDYERFGSTYLVQTGAEEWVRVATEDSLFFSIFISIKIVVSLLVLFLLTKVLSATVSKRIAGGEWHAVTAVFVLLILGISVQFLIFDTPCGDANEDAILRSAQITFAGLIVAAAPTLFLGPIFEELEIRGVIFKVLQNRTPWSRIVMSSIVFVYPHLVNRTGEFFPLEAFQDRVLILSSLFIWFPLGLVLGYAREVSGGLRLPILLHMLFNIAFTFFGLFVVAWGLC